MRLAKGKLLTLAARSSIGKSALAMNMGMNIASEGKNVLFFSLEMTKVEYMTRIMGSLSGTSSSQWQDGSVKDDLMHATMDKFMGVQDNIRIEYSSNITSDYIVKYANSYKKPDVIIIDYLQLLSDEVRK